MQDSLTFGKGTFSKVVRALEFQFDGQRQFDGECAIMFL